MLFKTITKYETENDSGRVRRSVDPPSVELTVRKVGSAKVSSSSSTRQMTIFWEECPVDAMRALGGHYMPQEGSGGV